MIGVYAFIPCMRGKWDINVDYIGVSKNINNRIKSHFRDRKPYASRTSGHVIYQAFEDREVAEIHEASLIEEFNPAYNRTTGREHRILYPLFYEVESIRNVINQLERKPW